MFPKNENGFKKNGILASNIKFSFMGEIASMSMRQVKISKPGQEEGGETSFSLNVCDPNGAEMSFWRRGQTQEGVLTMMTQLPLNQTLQIEGDVNIRKGHTYLNAKRILYPDGTPFTFRVSELASDILKEDEEELENE